MPTSGGHDHRYGRGEITRWFPTSARDLPWRRVRTPWRSGLRVHVAANTGVTRAERFEPFLDAFPSPLAMVEAGEDAVLAKWSGMGYYRRARMLHAAALAIVEQHDGVVPEDAATLRPTWGRAVHRRGDCFHRLW